jgi:hypothetical protein
MRRPTENCPVRRNRTGLYNIKTQEITRAIPHQQGDLGLPHAEDFGDLDLCHAFVLEDDINLQGELRAGG